jgi:hypothetical protein
LTTDFLATLASMVEGSMPFEAKTNSRGLAAPKGLDLPLLGSAVDAAAPADLGFN